MARASKQTSKGGEPSLQDRAAASSTKRDALVVAERVHSAAIRLLRAVRAADDETGLSAPKLSALSVLVFAGPKSLGALARAEQVTAATMSKLVSDLEAAGLASKRTDHTDRRGVRIEVTAKGRALLLEGRKARLALLRKKLAGLSARELAALDEAAAIMLRLAAE
jgi:DNA-binding MarR family transcriptional regulator